MPRRKDTKFTTLKDGSLDICSVKGRKIVETRQAGIRFGFRTVGIKRFYEAKVLSNQIDEVVAILPVEDISTMDICIIGEKQYKIIQIQNKYDAAPPCLLLSLERVVTTYEDVRNHAEN